MSPPFFIVGCPRSGTTLLRNLLRSHSNLTVPPESEFIPTFYRAYGDPGDPEAARRLAARILRLNWVRRLRVALRPPDFERCRSFREIIERIYGSFAERNGAGRWGDKTPSYALEIPTLDRIFADAQFIHILRDGRDVALSLMRTGIGPRSAYTAARYWERHVRRARESGAGLGSGRYREVRYEELISDPVREMREVCGFLGEPFEDALLEPTPIDWHGLPRTLGPRPARMVSDTMIVRENAGKWRHSMGENDRALFEGVAGRLLSELGYETTGTSGFRPGAFSRMAWAMGDRGRWARYQLARENKALWVPDRLRLRWAGLRARALGARWG